MKSLFMESMKEQNEFKFDKYIFIIHFLKSFYGRSR